MKSRRSFLKLMATGSAAVLAGAATATTAAAAPAKRPARTTRATPTAEAPTVASPSEIRKQKEQTAAILKAIRAFKLPPGTEPAFVFAAMRASPRSRGGRRKDRP